MKTYYLSELSKITGAQDRFQLVKLLIQRTRTIVSQKDKFALLKSGAINDVLFDGITRMPETEEEKKK